MDISEIEVSLIYSIDGIYELFVSYRDQVSGDSFVQADMFLHPQVWVNLSGQKWILVVFTFIHLEPFTWSLLDMQKWCRSQVGYCVYP